MTQGAEAGQSEKLSVTRPAVDARRAICSLLLVLVAWQGISLAKSLGFSVSRLGEAFRLHAGEQDSLPPQVLQLLALSRHSGLKATECALGSKTSEDSLLMQRTHEAIYPVRIDPDVKACILTTDLDVAGAACAVVVEESHARIVDCE